MGQGTEARPLGGKGDESNRSNPNSGSTRRAVNESSPKDGVTVHAPAAVPAGGHNNVHDVNTADEGKVKGNYDYLLNSPKISSTRHPLPADVKDFDHHFAGDKKAAKSKK